MKGFFKIVIVIVSIFLLVSAYTGFSIYSFMNNEVRKSDGILVLGCRVRGETPSVSLKRRMETALDLYNNGYGKKLILSGGQGKGEDISEAEAMKRFFISKGIIESDLLIEDKSTSTYENFNYSKDIMDKNNIKSVVVVSNGYHLKRASKVAENFNINATYKGFILRDYMSVEVKGVIREILATYKYTLLGK